MIEVQEVKDKKMIKEFIDFPLELYKDSPYFVPPLYSDELSLFKKDYVYAKTCETVYYNCYKDGKMVGRISGIIQKQSNIKNNEKRARFTRFDAIDDVEVAEALFKAVEAWAVQKGMDTVCGPLGFSDLEREGLLIEGFDELSTFEEQYNYDYYQKLIESQGYQKEIDWFEHKIYRPNQVNEKMHNISKKSLDKYGLRIYKAKTTKELLKKYSDKIFNCLDVCYRELYGTVDFTDEMKKQMIFQFNLLINPKYVGMILDKEDNVVGFGVCFPSFSEALLHTGGKLNLFTILKVLVDLRHPTVLDLGLVAIMPKYQRTGVSACIVDFLSTLMIENKIDYCETNLNLETNTAVRSVWNYFEHKDHKIRRSFIKKL